MHNATESSEHGTTYSPTRTVCPAWCREEREHHGELHESRLTYIDLPDKRTIYVGASEDAAPETAGLARPRVTAHNGDDPLFTLAPAHARSLAAALVAAANTAEGHGR